MITFKEYLEEKTSPMDIDHGAGKELKDSPSYKRDIRRNKQMIASRKETESRVKRGYSHYSDKDEWGNLKTEEKDPCWKGYRQLGMKKKNGKEVPNCVPKE